MCSSIPTLAVLSPGSLGGGLQKYPRARPWGDFLVTAWGLATGKRHIPSNFTSKKLLVLSNALEGEARGQIEGGIKIEHYL